MAIPAIIKPQTCDLPGYEALTVNLRLNPTMRELRDWREGTLGTPGCPDCAAAGEGGYCPACAAKRSQKARACVVLYGPSLLDRPCTTEQEALAILDDEDYPVEVFWWLFTLPDTAIDAWRQELLGNWFGSATTPSTSATPSQSQS